AWACATTAITEVSSSCTRSARAREGGLLAPCDDALARRSRRGGDDAQHDGPEPLGLHRADAGDLQQLGRAARAVPGDGGEGRVVEDDERRHVRGAGLVSAPAA